MVFGKQVCVNSIRSLIVAGLFLLGVSTVVHAEDKLQVKLINMQAEALSEENGDEVYISVTKYSNQGHPEEFRIPSAPKNWFFKRLSEAKNVTLWEGTVATGEEIKLLISIAEQDFPPWDVDDLIGTLQLDLKRVKGRLVEAWSIPAMDGQPSIEDKGAVSSKGRRYVLHGDNSRYEIELMVLGH
ncbi:MAG: hypothetical protein RLZ35_51 [Pseudomonadota bacterium]|jgi:hypothetical protein